MPAYLSYLTAVFLLATGLVAAPAAADIPVGDHTLEFVDPSLRIWLDDEVPPPLTGCASGVGMHLADAFLAGVPAGIPAVTGAARPVVLGSLTPGVRAAASPRPMDSFAKSTNPASIECPSTPSIQNC